MTSLVSVKHNFETAHRLYPLGGKCQNLHGHSWKVQWWFEGERDEIGIIGDFGSLKRELRGFVDEYLDHGTALGYEDPLRPALEADGGKLFLFGRPSDSKNSFQELAEDLKWPTVENMAILLQKVAVVLVDLKCVRVAVSETSVNSAEWVGELSE